MSEPSTIILGIDPGTQITGYALLCIEGKELQVVQYGILRLTKYPSHFKKLEVLFHRVAQLIDEYRPSVVAIEAPFYGNNVQSMLKLGRAQGTAIAAALHAGIEVAEYAPKKVKQSVTGNGNASKEQVAAMLGQILKMELLSDSLDATDALAVALCHYYHGNRPQSRGRAAGWKNFIEDNPDRVKK